MILTICENCKHGSIKNGQSHCGKEALYSHLTGCIRQQALEEYLERNTLADMKNTGMAVSPDVPPFEPFEPLTT